MLFGDRARCGLPPATPSYVSWELHLRLWLRSLAWCFSVSVALRMASVSRLRLWGHGAAGIELGGLDELRLR